MIPAEPTEGVRFNPPPAWTVPAGFDPRRGHLADPAWPTPPDGWAFWVTDPAATVGQSGVPTTTVPRGHLEAGERRRLVLTLCGVALFIGLIVWASMSGGKDEELTGVGSCWAGDERVYPMSCDSANADYIVETEVTTPEQCPMSSSGYVEEGDNVLCLKSLG